MLLHRHPSPLNFPSSFLDFIPSFLRTSLAGMTVSGHGGTSITPCRTILTPSDSRILLKSPIFVQRSSTVGKKSLSRIHFRIQ